MRVGDRRRELLLDSAERLLDGRSVAELTIEEIASTASLSRSSVYFYFESKSAIIDALIVRASDEMFDEMFEQHGRRGSRESLREFFTRVIAVTHHGWRRRRTVLLVAGEIGTHQRHGNHRWRTIMTAFVERIAEAMLHDTVSPAPEDEERVWLAAEVISWMVERNNCMLFAREHSRQDEERLAEMLVGSAVAIARRAL